MKKKLSRFGGRNPEKFNFEKVWQTSVRYEQEQEQEQEQPDERQ